jgi:diguanylate cyclase (GGDEF)-like protein
LATMSRFPADFRRRVLLVDDDGHVRGALARQLQSLGYVADVAGDGAKALLMAAAYDYEVIVTDLLMPTIDGMELMSILARRSAVTSFILMTGAKDLGNHISPAVDGRLTTVLAKPLGKHELQNALDQAFEVAGKRRALSAPPAAEARVLLIEDSSSDALLVRHALDTLGGFHVTHVERLAHAVRLLHDDSFDTVITDLTLPDARGLDAVLRIRDCAPDALLLVCSSVEDEALALRVLELGAQDFIVKGSLDSDTLGRAIRFAKVRRQGERRLARLAHSDPLTGLWNRAAFAERLDHALAQAKRHATRLSVMYIDLDGFKTVNDEHGHDVGDALLKQAARRVAQCTREYDAVARLGGDEFAVLATNLAEGSATVTAERIARALAAPFETDFGELTVTASIGISSFPENAEEAVLLVKLADEAMYLAKRSGKNRICGAARAADTLGH